MIKIIDGRGTGKTSRLMLLAKEQEGIIVCSDPEIYRQKAYAYGLTGIDFISYNEYIYNLNMCKAIYVDTPIFIDELDEFLTYIHKNISGYTLSLENNKF